MSDRTPFWRADPRAWPLIVETMAGREWPTKVVEEDLWWHEDQIRRGYVEDLPSRRKLVTRWGWSDRRVRTRLQALGTDPNDVPIMSQRRPKDVPAASQPRPNPERLNQDNDGETSQPCPKDVPAVSQGCPSDVPTMSTRALDPESRVQSPENTPSLFATASPKPKPIEDAARRIVAAIRGTDKDTAATALKPVLALWKALKLTDVEAFERDVILVARACRESPDKLFAHDVRAEGWEGGTDRSRSVSTVCVQARWQDRLDAAARWAAIAPPADAAPTPRLSPTEQDRADAERFAADAERRTELRKARLAKLAASPPPLRRSDP